MVVEQMVNNVKARTTCRLCESLRIRRVLELAPMPIGDSYVPKQMEHIKQQEYPLEVYLCRNCDNVQLGHVIDPKIVYGNYIYRTADSLGLVEHFRKYAASVLNTHNIPEQSLIVEIGSNDGSLLKAFKEKKMRVVGIDPAKKIAEEATKAGIKTIPELFDEHIAENVKKEYGTASIVIANNVIANIDDLHTMIKGIKKLLADDGVFICETGYVKDLIEKTILDNIYHEHISYFAAKPLKTFFGQFGLRLQNVEHVQTKGGSIRCTVVQSNSNMQPTENVQRMIQEEQHDHQQFLLFDEHIKQIKDNLMRFFDNSKEKSVAGYGASVGVTTMLYNFGIDKQIHFLVDDNPNRQGLLSPGKHIPVKSKQALLDENVDYCVIFAWQYNEPIVAKNKAFLENGGKFVTILPEFGLYRPNE